MSAWCDICISDSETAHLEVGVCGERQYAVCGASEDVRTITVTHDDVRQLDVIRLVILQTGIDLEHDVAQLAAVAPQHLVGGGVEHEAVLVATFVLTTDDVVCLPCVGDLRGVVHHL